MREKGRGHPDNILVLWDVCVYEVGQKVVVASFSLSFHDPGHDLGVWLFSLSIVGLIGAVTVMQAEW